MKIILGSGSPRRSQLLSELGFSFVVLKPEIDESIEAHWSTYEVAEHLARKKSNALLNQIKHDEVLLCADTVVIDGDQILGKPASKEEAIQMISRLSGSCHSVVTGVSLRNQRVHISFSEKTEVCFYPLTQEEIIQYVDLYKPLDKAGAYGIQEWIGMIGVSSIKGSYTNVIGLPTSRLFQELKNFK